MEPLAWRLADRLACRRTGNLPFNPPPPDRMTAPRSSSSPTATSRPMTSKTANSVIRYLPERIVGVLDRQLAGKTVQDVLGFGGAIPVVGSMREGLALGADRRPDRHRASGRPAAGGVARLDGARRSTAAASSGAACTPSSATTRCWPRKARAAGAQHPRRAEAARRPPDRGRARRRRGAARRAHGGHRLQRRQDDRPAAAPRRARTRAGTGPASSRPARPGS